LWDKIEQTAARGKAGVVLEIDGRAVLALIGDGIEQAKELCSQACFAKSLAVIAPAEIRSGTVKRN